MKKDLTSFLYCIVLTPTRNKLNTYQKKVVCSNEISYLIDK